MLFSCFFAKTRVRKCILCLRLLHAQRHGVALKRVPNMGTWRHVWGFHGAANSIFGKHPGSEQSLGHCYLIWCFVERNMDDSGQGTKILKTFLYDNVKLLFSSISQFQPSQSSHCQFFPFFHPNPASHHTHHILHRAPHRRRSSGSASRSRWRWRWPPRAFGRQPPAPLQRVAARRRPRQAAKGQSPGTKLSVVN